MKNSDPSVFDPQKNLLAISKNSTGDVLAVERRKSSVEKKNNWKDIKMK